MGRDRGFKTIVILIALVLWVGFAYGLATWMISREIGAWWQLLIGQCFLWLAYVTVARLVQGDIFEED